MTMGPNPTAWRRLCAGALLGALAAAGTALGPVPDASAQTSFQRAVQIRNATPSCRDNPDAAVKGYVVGLAGDRPTRTYSFVGCFLTMAACNRWRTRTSGFITRRIIQNRCEPRR